MELVRCPYCEVIGKKSRDHIFSDFFGGKKTIISCEKCNSMFGGTFEGLFIKEITPLVVLLSICNVKPKRKVIWKNAFIGKNGVKYDLDSDLIGIPSTKVEYGEDGSVKKIITAKKSVKKKLDSLKHSYPDKDFTMTEEVINDLRPDFNISFKFDSEIRRISIKMCVGLLTNFKHLNVIDEKTRKYLLKNEADVVPVRIGYVTYKSLDDLRPPLSHTIYVEGNKKTGYCYGVVQFFGAVQMYCVLNDQYTGENFSLIGIYDSIKKEESFFEIDPLKLETPLINAQFEVYHAGMYSMWQKFNSQIKEVFGKNSIFFETTHVNSQVSI